MNEVRPPAVAGTFYPARPEVLARTVDGLLGAAPRPAAGAACPKALIVPHAGYVYSGAIAAAAFAKIAPFAERITRVVLVGPAHRMFVDGLATPGAARLATPLGELEVDAAAAELPASPQAHAREHCLEVELPFLQRVAPRAAIVPVIGSRARPSEVGALLERLWGGPETLIVISSDLSHYEPYAAARAHDARTAKRIVALDATIEPEDACGALGINGLLWLARRHGPEVEVVDLRSSGDPVGEVGGMVRGSRPLLGDTAGSKAEVVGYGAFAVYA